MATTGDRRDAQPGIRDVARYAEVSVGTVSNVLNYPHKVSEATITKVQDAIDALGFVRNYVASSLAAGSSSTIGLVLIGISNTLFVDVARGAQKGALAQGMNLLITTSEDDVAQQEAHLDYFDGTRVAGILFAPSVDSRIPISSVRTHRRPTVLINRDTEPRVHCSVIVDNEHVGYIAARHLIELGRTRIAFVAGRDYMQPVQLRRVGVLRAIAEENGRVSLEEITTSDLNHPGGSVAGRELAARPPEARPDGVIAVTDLLGMAVIQELTAASISVPNEVAVIGCDYNSAAWGGAIPLTTIRLRGFDMGIEAARLLIDEISTSPDEHEHKTVVLEPSLLVRQSTVNDGPTVG
jgi:LacI family transcriptional regulator